MKIEIKTRWSDTTIYVAEDVASLGVAILQAVSAGVDLRGANLSRADLHGANLSRVNLSDANLVGADLSDARLSGATLSDACLANAALSGANLSGAILTDADLSDAQLPCANLSGACLRDATLSGADLRDASLSGADLRDASLSGADLRGAVFDELSLNIPRVEQLDARVLAAITSEGGTLDMLQWHGSFPKAPVCGSTHCRAGWAVHLAGEAGYALEHAVGPSAAGALIYAFSTGRPVPDFYAQDEEALENIKRCAGLMPQSKGA